MADYYDSMIEVADDAAVLAVSGETDLYTAPRFKRDVERLLSSTSGSVVLDLTDLDLIDSTALRILISALTQASDEGRSLLLVIARRHVLRVFAITGLRGFFSIFSTRDEALDALAGGHRLGEAA